jgi:Tfp pilus assembly protein PilX
MRRLLREESGFALVVALGVMIVLTILVSSLIGYASSNQRAAQLSARDLQALHYAEGGLNGAYSVLIQQSSSGGNAAAPNLLGCSGSVAPSDCSNPTPDVFCIAVAAGCTAATAGSASVYGYFTGTNPQTVNGIAVPASTWLLVATGYANNPNTGRVTAKGAMAQVKISPLSLTTNAVAAVWNHLFVTSPLIPNVCALSFSGNSVTVSAPLYVIGNLCLGSNGTGASIIEQTQPVDVQVGGKLVLLGGSKVGADSTHQIASGVVGGGCTSVSVSSSTTPCSPNGFNYWVKTTDTFIPNDAPTKTPAQAASDYANFDPGPKHSCEAGTNPPPLAASVFDNDTAGNLGNEPNDSASSFELTPNSSYSCISQNGASVGQLTWNNSTKTLTVNGSIFIDGNLTISQPTTYTGSAVLEVAGTITFNGNTTTLCATGPPCNTSPGAWQGSSGNNAMLTLVSLASSATAITFSNNSQTFQGSLWTQPSSTLTFVKNGVTLEGPMSIGSFDATFNNANLIPFPVIENMPLGAPLPPNQGVTVNSLIYTK